VSAEEFHQLIENWMHRRHPADMQRLHKKMEKRVAELARGLSTAERAELLNSLTKEGNGALHGACRAPIEQAADEFVTLTGATKGRHRPIR
jgi:hypothetical protein